MQRFNEKDYISVQDRINRFWHDNPNGSVVTELLSTGDNFDHVVIRAKVYRTHQLDSGLLPDATGIAAETRGASFKDGANFTSWHENAETSAIGRALANMGYATSQADRMSREEAQKVNRAIDATQTRSDAPGATLPPRDRSTTTNAVPNIAQGDTTNSDAPITDWTEFWNRVRKLGIAADKKHLEEQMGQTLPFDPAFALEMVTAWVHDTERQAALP